MQIVIGSYPGYPLLQVPPWIALAWLAIIFYTSDNECRFVSSLVLSLLWTHQSAWYSYRFDMKPENVLRAAVLAFKPAFDGKETEQNWALREKHIIKMREMCHDLTPATRPLFLKTINEMLDDLLKTVNSLRTTVSTNGCLFFQELFTECGSHMDGMVEILLQNFIKLSANTKPIARTNANDTIVALIRHCHYRLYLIRHIHAACKDKNVQPRRFACEWLNKVIKHNVSTTIDQLGGLDLIEASIKLGLEDRDKDVREAMRPTYWNFARRWPERSEILFSTLDKMKQDQLIADPSNPNPPAPSTPSKANSAVKVSRMGSPAMSKPSLKDIKAKLVAAKIPQPSLEDVKVVADRISMEASAPKLDKPSTTSAPKFEKSSTVPAPKLEKSSAVPAPRLEKSSTGPAPKPSLKEIKARLATQKKAQSSTEASLPDTDKAIVEGPIPESDPFLAAPLPQSSRSQVKSQQKTAQPSTEAPLLDTDNSQIEAPVPKPDTSSVALLPKSSLSEAKAQSSMQLKAKQTTAKDSNSTIIPTTENAQDEASVSKNSTISAAPVRRKRSRHPRRNKSKSPEALEPKEHDELQEPKEPWEEEDTWMVLSHYESAKVDATKAIEKRLSIEREEKAKKAAAKALNAADAPEHEASILPNATEFLAWALPRLSKRTLDHYGFRKLQMYLREDSKNPMYEIVIKPLCEWIEFQESDETISTSEWQDIQAMALATLRRLIINPLWATEHHGRIMSTLISANCFYMAHGPAIVGIKRNLNFIINHCDLLACLHAIANLMDAPRHDSVAEIGLLTLGAMLHRIHEDDAQEGAFYKRLAEEQALVQRLGEIGKCGLHSKEISVRKAAIRFAQEFWHTVPQENFLEVIAASHVETRDLLKYYVARHVKFNDHIEYL